jgi:nitroreductase
MELLETLRQRHSVRAYRADEVEPEKLEAVLEAAVLAPTACNVQPFQLLVIHTLGRREELARIYARPWFADAPLVIGICSLPGVGWRRRDGKSYSDIDATIAMDHLILAATSLGLGTCWVAAFDPGAAREVLRLPAEVEPVAFTPLGYAADEPRPRTRKALGELVRYEGW